ncbi:hypothetical protein Oter_1559 [Opitutus terrae PB90-1]|uniref:Uncharacterized protein n=2 Tax=Opitutus terrae TaxID=107709 RepID=B1ZTQ7_OPITP|nr:hypothetical protein Oter_1559 [Opitutus terrae PB90-1]
MLVVALALPAAAPACDLCAVYSAVHAQGLSSSAWTLSAATQFTHFGTLRLDGERVADPADQRMDSVITQLVARRAFSPRWSAQLNVPLITRSFRRPSAEGIEDGRERGLGDISVLARGEVFRRETEQTTFILDAHAGMKLPTGSTRRLAEETTEEDEPDAAPPILALLAADSEIRPFHDGHAHGPASGVHGHDLTLGTGSTDAHLGANLFFRRARFLATALLQYTLRTRGDYDYRFANDLTWELAPGAYLILGHTRTLALQLVASGETKGRDDFAGERADDTGIRSVFLGPRVSATFGLNLSAALGADIPVSVDNTVLQLTPDYRLRASVSWSF